MDSSKVERITFGFKHNYTIIFIMTQIWRFFIILSAFDILALSGIGSLKGGYEMMFYLKFSNFT
jgi:hypothetical protein